MSSVLLLLSACGNLSPICLCKKKIFCEFLDFCENHKSPYFVFLFPERYIVGKGFNLLSKNREMMCLRKVLAVCHSFMCCGCNTFSPIIKNNVSDIYNGCMFISYHYQNHTVYLILLSFVYTK